MIKRKIFELYKDLNIKEKANLLEVLLSNDVVIIDQKNSEIDQCSSWDGHITTFNDPDKFYGNKNDMIKLTVHHYYE